MKKLWIQKPKKKLWMFMVNVLSFANGQGMWQNWHERCCVVHQSRRTRLRKSWWTNCHYRLYWLDDPKSWWHRVCPRPMLRLGERGLGARNDWDPSYRRCCHDRTVRRIESPHRRRHGTNNCSKNSTKMRGNGGERNKTMQKMRMWWPCVSYPLVN